ncbi:MAG TPA: Hpt domain-containing protein [Propionibacteriaceae bacterium]
MKLMRKGEVATILGRIGDGFRSRAPEPVPQRAVPAPDAAGPPPVPVVAPPPIAGSTPPVVPAVNPDTLRDLGQGIHDHDGTLLLDLIEKFLHGGDDITAGLTRAAAAGDVPQAHQLAHNLLSASTLMGAVPLADLLRLVQRVGVDEPAELVPLATQVQAEYRRVKATMHRLGTVGISSHDETDGDLASRADG